MIRVLVLASVLLLSTLTVADAGRKRGGGGRRLSRVGSGLRAGASRARSITGSSRSWWRADRDSRHTSYRTKHLHDDSPVLLPSFGIAGDLYGGLQKLVESDAAYSLEGRLLFGPTVGVAGRFSQFRERTAEMSTLVLDLWSASATFQVQASQRVTFSPEIGVAGLRFRGDGEEPLSELGSVAGISARVRLAHGAALVGSGRVYLMTGAGSAVELRAGIATGPIQLSYRALSFYEAGPPLEGPEVGLGFTF